MIGKDKTLDLKEGRLSIDKKSCWVDAFAIEHLLTKAEGLWDTYRSCQRNPELSQHISTQAIQLTQSAHSLYNGHFLANEPEQSWMFFLQDRLRTKYKGCMESLAGYWVSIGEMETAINYYNLALEADELAEEFYQHLMSIYTQLGRRTKALEVYNRCRAVLNIRLGVAPSAKTQAILETIRGKIPC